MSDKGINEGDIHKIVNTKIKEHKTEISGRLDSIESDNKKQTETLTTVRLAQETIKGKLDAIYGNGSGKKGILDRLEDKQDASDDKVSILEKSVADESKKQASFRHDIRNQFETLLLEKQKEKEALKVVAEERQRDAAIVKEEKKDKNEWIKWLIGALMLLGSPLLLELFKTHHWLGLH